MKIIKVTLSILVVSLIAPALTSANSFLIDSLKQQLFTELKLEAKADVLNDLSWEYRHVSSDSGLSYGQKALIFSKQINYPQGIATAYKRMGSNYINQGDLEQAIVHFTKGYKGYASLKDTLGMMHCIYNIAMVYDYKNSWDSAFTYHQKSLELSAALHDSIGIALEYSNLGDYYRRKGSFNKAYQCYDSSIVIAKQINYQSVLKVAYHNCGIVAEAQADYYRALQYYYLSYDIDAQEQNRQGIAYSLLNIGNIFLMIDDFKNAEGNYKKALSLCETINDTVAIGTCYGHLGMLYVKQELLPEAESALKIALATSRKYKFNDYTVSYLNDLGRISIKQGKSKIAESYIYESINMAKQIGDEPDLIDAYTALALLNELKNEDEACIKNAKLALKKATILHLNSIQVETTALLSRAYQNLNKYSLALAYAQLHKNYSDSAMNTELVKQLTRMQVDEEHLIIEQDLLDNQEKEKLAHDLANAKHKNIVYIYSVIVFALLVLIFFIYRENRIKRKSSKIQNRKNLVITKQNKDLLHQKEEIITQRDILSKQQKSIRKSMEYASKIQSAMLPKPDRINSLFSEYFILFKPCEIVSGDFYFLDKVNDKIIIVCADSTGHGVPGALLSMMGMAFISNSIKSEKLDSASEILERLRENFILSLDQKGILGEPKDGIDMSLLILDIHSNKLQYAGAHSPLFIYRNELDIYKPDIQPIGYYIKEKAFTNHEIQLQENDVIYLLTDGYRDQMAPKTMEKYSSKRFKNKLKEIHNLPMADQHTSLEKEIDSWRSNGEQTDDILVMGFKIV